MMHTDTDMDDRGLDLFGDTHNCDEEKLDSATLEVKEDEVLQPQESMMMKYNLRKSLAWDKAFFTNAGKFLFFMDSCSSGLFCFTDKTVVESRRSGPR